VEIPVTISLHGISPSDAIRQSIQEHANRLERFAAHITSCRVVLEIDGRHARGGRQLRVKIALAVPGRELVVSREHHEDLQVALREAFADARRQLQDHARIQRGDVKLHAR
jgi:ribosomal subunit interface protein